MPPSCPSARPQGERTLPERRTTGVQEVGRHRSAGGGSFGSSIHNHLVGRSGEDGLSLTYPHLSPLLFFILSCKSS